jgi:hypothetical protein
MHTIKDLIICACRNLLTLVDVRYGRITELFIRNIPENLEYLKSRDADQFDSNLNTFVNYIRTYKSEVCVTYEFTILNKHIYVYKNQNGSYKIGDAVIHNKKLAYIVDYIDSVDMYEIIYNDASVFGETHGWFKDIEFNK